MANFSERPGSGRGAPRSPMAREIDANLKRVYQASLSEEVPDRFKALLDALREKEAPGAAADGAAWAAPDAGAAGATPPIDTQASPKDANPDGEHAE